MEVPVISAHEFANIISQDIGLPKDCFNDETITNIQKYRKFLNKYADKNGIDMPWGRMSFYDSILHIKII